MDAAALDAAAAAESMGERFPRASVPIHRSARGHAEATAAWLSRSTVPLAVSSRFLVNSWASLPGAADDDVLARLRQHDDRQFGAAFLELYLFAAFARATWPCERLTGSGKTPDFRVVAQGGPMYVEATTAGPARELTDAERRKKLLLDDVNKLSCDGFALTVAVAAVGRESLAPGPVRRELSDWLAGLDPDAVLAAVAAAPTHAESDEEAGYPVHVTVREGWDIEWTAHPRSREWRGRQGRLIGSERMPEVVAVRDEKPLRNALQRKASRYGRLGAPYLVAVGEEPFSPQGAQDHRTDALYGSSAVVVDRQAGRPVRLPDGSWRRGRTWRSTRVSGVLFLADLHPWTALETVPELWINPAAPLSVPNFLPYWRMQRVEEIAGQGRLRTEPPAMSPASFWLDKVVNEPG